MIFYDIKIKKHKHPINTGIFLKKLTPSFDQVFIYIFIYSFLGKNKKSEQFYDFLFIKIKKHKTPINIGIVF